MNTISLLVAVILLSVMIGKNTSPYARAIIGSMFGIFYFALWRFYLFYANLYEISGLHRHIVFFVLVLSAAILSLIFVRIKFYYAVAAVSVVLFIVSVYAAFWANIPIQNEIAILSGFYKPEATPEFAKTTNEIKFTQASGRYTVAISRAWQLHKDKGPLFPYFTWQDKGRSVLEFRPRCFNKSVTSIPLIVMNIRDSEDVAGPHLTTKCNEQTELNAYSCHVYQYQKNKRINRIEYLASYDKSSKGIELDFVLSQDTPDVLKSVNRVIQSVKPLSGEGGRCLGLAEWM